MNPARRTFRPHEIAQMLGALDRMAESCANGWYAATLADAAAIVRQLARECAELNAVTVLVRRWFSDADGTCLIPEEIDERARKAVVATGAYRTLARGETPRKGPTP